MVSNFAFIGLAAVAAVTEIAPVEQALPMSEQSSSHPKYKDCTPPKNFAERFPKTNLDQAVKNSLGYLTYAKPGPLERNNPVLGAGSDSNDVYAKKFFGIAVYGYDHTYASVERTLDGNETYNVVSTSTNYSTFSKNTIFNQLSEIYVTRKNVVVPIKLTSENENGWCSYQSDGKPPSCFSTATAIFQMQKPLFEELAQENPAQPLVVTAKLHDGSFTKCPLYFSPLSFKAPLVKIETQFAKAVEKRKKQLAKSK